MYVFFGAELGNIWIHHGIAMVATEQYFFDFWIGSQDPFILANIYVFFLEESLQWISITVPGTSGTPCVAVARWLHM
tara:strand:+ start:1104 stop:1334 length:231 start_codon:yes stop_codon:yes gene_type:complete